MPPGGMPTGSGLPPDASQGGGPTTGAGAPRAIGGAEVPELGLVDLVIEHELARGGFGVVYRAQQTALNRTVAVKLLLAEVRDEKVRMRFERECTAMGLLSDHPHIVTVFDAGFSPTGQPYILMDFMTGGSLADTLERQGPMGWEEVLAVTVKLSSALETAHRSGVLHRDMKPENVLWSAYGEPELGDFGIARLAGGPETRTDTLTASIAHVAPELLAGDPPSVATDLYALGSTCYVLLSGRSAFIHDTDESIVPALTRITAAPVPDLRRDGVPGEVAALVERLMHKEPSERFVSALALGVHVQELQRQLGLPVTPVHVPGEAAYPDAPAQTSPLDVGGVLEQTVEGVPPALDSRGAADAVDIPAPADDADRHLETAAPTVPLAVGEARKGRRTPALMAVACAVLVVVGTAAVLVSRGSTTDEAAGQVGDGAPIVDAGSGSDDAIGVDAGSGGETGAASEDEHTGEVTDAALGDDGGQLLDVTQVAAQIAEIRGLPLRGNFDARRYRADRYAPLVRAYAGGSQRDQLEAHGRVLTALRLLPPDGDHAELTRSLWEEQFHGFFDESVGRVHVRGEGASLSAFERSVLADELMIALLDSAFDLGALHEDAGDLDADRAVSALIKGDTFVSSGVWAERFLTAEEQEQRAADLALLPDLVARSAPLAIRGEFVFPFVAGPDLVRSLFAQGGVEALDAAYADPPTTTEQVLHPEKYATREPALLVEVAARPDDPAWTELVRRSFGEYDLLQLLAELEPDEAEDAAAGWGGGQLTAWTSGEETAVAVWLEMDTVNDGAAACDAIPIWYLLSGGVPAGEGRFSSPGDALAVTCDGTSVRFAVAPAAAIAAGLLG